jgi:hypothetical protein
MRQEGRVNRDVHGDQASCVSVTAASRFLTGLVLAGPACPCGPAIDPFAE